MSNDRPETTVTVVPVARAKGLLRAFLRLLAAAILGVFVGEGMGNVRSRPIGTTNFLIEYAPLVFLIPFLALDLWLLAAALRWLLLAVWPAREAIVFSDQAIELRLGPFGLSRMDVDRLFLRYPHEMDPEQVEEPYEAFEDPVLQEAKRLPILRHPDYNGRVDWLIQRFVSLDEPSLASRIAPFVRAYRRRHGLPEEPTREAPRRPTVPEE